MFILASQSPRRREILERFFKDFKVVPSNADESVITENPREKAVEVARKKAWEVYNRTGGTVLGADTIVVLENKALGKPKNEEEAEKMLKLLSGKIHEVITGYCIIHEGKEIAGFEVTKVKFRDLSEEEIEWYVSTGEPLDKAGAYAIQGKAAIFIEWIYGDFYNVVGLPIKVVLELKKLGFPLKQF
ncbi:Maf-like protein [Thermococcus sp. SY098]|uniref:Maf-like protein n=1 Tax=Thermococcus sp. SY098 TaxID=3111325 RepID=UPI002D798511|nr:Maf-like protein [Thermococcus sp. SY098]WRS53189.1 Maf-like protein [Thermococcus sp. SY098]